MEDLFTHVHIDRCSHEFLNEVIQTNAELFNSQITVYRLICQKVLSKSTKKQQSQQSTKKQQSQQSTKKQQSQGNNKTLIVLGGQSYNGALNKIVWKLDNNKQLTELMHLPKMDFVAEQSICQIPCGLLWTGGLDSDVCLMFVTADNKWQKRQKMLSKRNGHGSIYNNGKVFVIGGNLSSVDYYDVENNTWNTGPALHKAIDLPGVASMGTAVYVLDTQYGELHELDTVAMSWVQRATMPQPSPWCSMTAADDGVHSPGQVSLMHMEAWYSMTRNLS